MNPSFSEESLLGYACNISLVNSKFGTNCACHNNWVIRLEADTSMIDTLATGVTLLVSSATNATALIQPGVLRYPWNAKIGGGYSVSCKYQNNLYRTCACFSLMLLDAVESDLIGNWSSGVFSIAF
jgi:hypothetical protein